MRLENGSLIVAVCESIDADSLWLSAIDDGEWTRVWSAEGMASIKVGSLISYGVAPDGMDTTRLSRSDQDFAGLVVNLSLLAQGEPAISLSQRWDDLREDKWRDQLGNYVDTPCLDPGS